MTSTHHLETKKWIAWGIAAWNKGRLNLHESKCIHYQSKNAFKLLPISGDILVVSGLIQKSGCWQILLKKTKYENRQACERDIV